MEHEHAALLEEISSFCRQHSSPRAIAIATDYMQQVRSIEQRRHAALRNQQPAATHNHLDEQRLRLIREARQQMQQYQDTTQPDPDAATITDPEHAAKSAKKSNGRFSERATLLLETWYAQNLTYPYISPPEAERLARKAGITPKEVKKWLDNRRNRDENSKKKKERPHPYS